MHQNFLSGICFYSIRTDDNASVKKNDFVDIESNDSNYKK